jgi:hypothetical protein
MGHKRRPTAHQKQIRFLMFLFGALMLLVLLGVMLLLNRPVGGYH